MSITNNFYDDMDTRNTTEATKNCLDCEGTGVVTLPAHGSCGEIVDEEQHACACTLED